MRPRFLAPLPPQRLLHTVTSRPTGGNSGMALSDAERAKLYRERRKAVRYRKPRDRRSRPERWADAVQTLADLLDDYAAPTAISTVLT